MSQSSLPLTILHIPSENVYDTTFSERDTYPIQGEQKKKEENVLYDMPSKYKKKQNKEEKKKRNHLKH